MPLALSVQKGIYPNDHLGDNQLNEHYATQKTNARPLGVLLIPMCNDKHKKSRNHCVRAHVRQIMYY